MNIILLDNRLSISAIDQFTEEHLINKGLLDLVLDEPGYLSSTKNRGISLLGKPHITLLGNLQVDVLFLKLFLKFTYLLFYNLQCDRFIEVIEINYGIKAISELGEEESLNCSRDCIILNVLLLKPYPQLTHLPGSCI